MTSSESGSTTAPAATGAATASRIVHAAIAAVVVFGLIIQLMLIFTGGADANSGEAGTTIPVGARLVRLFSFFTIQSNILVGVVATMLVIRPLRVGRGWRVARLDSLLGIVITGLVYAIILAPQVHVTGRALLTTICFHYVSPWLTLAAWLLFGPRPGSQSPPLRPRSSGPFSGCSTPSSAVPSCTGIPTRFSMSSGSGLARPS